MENAAQRSIGASCRGSLLLKIANICINTDYLLVHGPRLLTFLLLNADCFIWLCRLGDARDATIKRCFGEYLLMCVTSEVCSMLVRCCPPLQ